MANIHRKTSIYRLRDLVFDRFGSYRTRSGKTIPLTRFGEQPGRVSTQARNAPLFRMRGAAIYASSAQTQEIYQRTARGSEATPYSIALIDWLGAPKVLEIFADAWSGEPEQTIHVKARDNVGVAGVLVVIRDAAGKILELGEAAQAAPGSAWWIYVTASHVGMNPVPTVQAIARDHAGNRDSFSI